MGAMCVMSATALLQDLMACGKHGFQQHPLTMAKPVTITLTTQTKEIGENQMTSGRDEMLSNNTVNLTKVVGDKRKQEVVDMLQSALKRGEEDGATDVLIMLKSEGAYTRYSTKMDDVMEVIAQLEVLKFDILRRMHG